MIIAKRGPGKPRKAPRTKIPLVLEVLKAIDESGLTINEIGRVSGVHPNSFGYWRRGVYSGSIANMTAVANALGYELTLVKKERK